MKDNIRFNDGKCDPAGRFWAGTMDYDGKKNKGSLYCLDTDLTVKKVIDQISISNGIVWSIDQRTMYYIDSPTYQVVAFDYDIESGNISNKRIVINIDKKIGIPDGMAIDEQGNVWVALYGGGGVGCWNPHTGIQLSFITAPHAQLVTSCTFGGKDLQDLYITTASAGLDKELLDQQSNAGYIFHIRLPVRGSICTKFRG